MHGMHSLAHGQLKGAQGGDRPAERVSRHAHAPLSLLARARDLVQEADHLKKG